MPNTNPIIRSLEWNWLKQNILPVEISNQLPDGDPVQEKEKIFNELKEIEILGSEVKELNEEYVNGEITYEEFQEQIDKKCEDMNISDLDRYQKCIRNIRNELKFYRWRQIVPGFSAQNISEEKIKEYSEELDDIDL